MSLATAAIVATVAAETAAAATAERLDLSHLRGDVQNITY
jgi:hypothetical protein